MKRSLIVTTLVLITWTICGVISQEILSAKQEQQAPTAKDPVTIDASVSHSYITNDKKSNIGVLFSIETSDPATLNGIDKDESVDSDEQPRLPYELAIVLDRSGSMHGV